MVTVLLVVLVVCVLYLFDSVNEWMQEEKDNKQRIRNRQLQLLLVDEKQYQEWRKASGR